MPASCATVSVLWKWWRRLPVPLLANGLSPVLGEYSAHNHLPRMLITYVRFQHGMRSFPQAVYVSTDILCSGPVSRIPPGSAMQI